MSNPEGSQRGQAKIKDEKARDIIELNGLINLPAAEADEKEALEDPDALEIEMHNLGLQNISYSAFKIQYNTLILTKKDDDAKKLCRLFDQYVSLTSDHDWLETGMQALGLEEISYPKFKKLYDANLKANNNEDAKTLEKFFSRYVSEITDVLRLYGLNLPANSNEEFIDAFKKLYLAFCRQGDSNTANMLLGLFEKYCLLQDPPIQHRIKIRVKQNHRNNDESKGYFTVDFDPRLLGDSRETAFDQCFFPMRDMLLSGLLQENNCFKELGAIPDYRDDYTEFLRGGGYCLDDRLIYPIRSVTEIRSYLREKKINERDEQNFLLFVIDQHKIFAVSCLQAMFTSFLKDYDQNLEPNNREYYLDSYDQIAHIARLKCDFEFRKLDDCSQTKFLASVTLVVDLKNKRIGIEDPKIKLPDRILAKGNVLWDSSRMRAGLAGFADQNSPRNYCIVSPGSEQQPANIMLPTAFTPIDACFKPPYPEPVVIAAYYSGGNASLYDIRKMQSIYATFNENIFLALRTELETLRVGRRSFVATLNGREFTPEQKQILAEYDKAIFAKIRELVQLEQKTLIPKQQEINSERCKVDFGRMIQPKGDALIVQDHFDNVSIVLKIIIDFESSQSEYLHSNNFFGLRLFQKKPRLSLKRLKVLKENLGALAGVVEGVPTKKELNTLFDAAEKEAEAEAKYNSSWHSYPLFSLFFGSPSTKERDKLLDWITKPLPSDPQVEPGSSLKSKLASAKDRLSELVRGYKAWERYRQSGQQDADADLLLRSNFLDLYSKQLDRAERALLGEQHVAIQAQAASPVNAAADNSAAATPSSPLLQAQEQVAAREATPSSAASASFWGWVSSNLPDLGIYDYFRSFFSGSNNKVAAQAANAQPISPASPEASLSQGDPDHYTLPAVAANDDPHPMQREVIAH